MLPKNIEEFNSLMEKIETELIEENVPIHFRQIEAVRKVCMKFGIDLELVSHDVAPLPKKFEGESLSARIRDWYEERYGDRLKIDFGPGQAAILLRGDPWKIKFPLLLGSFKIVCDPDIEKYRNFEILSIRQIEYVCNPLICIDSMTTSLANSLNNDELRHIERFFLSALKTLHLLQDIKYKVFIPEATSDLQSAVSSLFPRTVHYGQSKWSSLQFLEKLLKCYLELKSVNYPRNHNLTELTELAENIGLSSLSRQLINKIECAAGVRYGEIPVTLFEAIEAHHVTLELCKQIAQDIIHL